MLEVISSYQELTGFLPVELTDKCSTAEVMSDNYTSQWLVNFGGRRPLTPFNSQQAELAKVKYTLFNKYFLVLLDIDARAQGLGGGQTTVERIERSLERT